MNGEGFLFCILSGQGPIPQGLQQIPHDFMTWKRLEAAEFIPKSGVENVWLAFASAFVSSNVYIYNIYVSSFALSPGLP